MSLTLKEVHVRLSHVLCALQLRVAALLAVEPKRGGLQVGVLTDIEVEEGGVGEHGQIVIEVEVLLLLRSEVLGRGDCVQVRDELGHVRTPLAVVVWVVRHDGGVDRR